MTLRDRVFPLLVAALIATIAVVGAGCGKEEEKPAAAGGAAAGSNAPGGAQTGTQYGKPTLN